MRWRAGCYNSIDQCVVHVPEPARTPTKVHILSIKTYNPPSIYNSPTPISLPHNLPLLRGADAAGHDGAADGGEAQEHGLILRILCFSPPVCFRARVCVMEDRAGGVEMREGGIGVDKQSSVPMYMYVQMAQRSFPQHTSPMHKCTKRDIGKEERTPRMCVSAGPSTTSATVSAESALNAGASFWGW